MRKDKADGWAAAQVQLGDDGRKVVAVSAQAVQPDDGGGRVGGGFEFDAGKQGGHGVALGGGVNRGALLSTKLRMVMRGAWQLCKATPTMFLKRIRT